MATSKFGITEFADGLGDIVHLLRPDGVRAVFDKPFELLLALVKAAEEYPQIKEFVNDWNVFVQEAGDLQLEEKDQVLQIIKTRFPDPDPIQAKVIEAYETVGFGFEYIIGNVIGGGKELVDRAKALVGK